MILWSNPKRAKLDCLVKNGFDSLTFYRKLVFAEKLFHISKRLVALGYDFYTESKRIETVHARAIIQPEPEFSAGQG